MSKRKPFQEVDGNNRIAFNNKRTRLPFASPDRFDFLTRKQQIDSVRSDETTPRVSNTSDVDKGPINLNFRARANLPRREVKNNAPTNDKGHGTVGRKTMTTTDGRLASVFNDSAPIPKSKVNRRSKARHYSQREAWKRGLASIREERSLEKGDQNSIRQAVKESSRPSFDPSQTAILYEANGGREETESTSSDMDIESDESSVGSSSIDRDEGAEVANQSAENQVQTDDEDPKPDIHPQTPQINTDGKESSKGYGGVIRATDSKEELTDYQKEMVSPEPVAKLDGKMESKNMATGGMEKEPQLTRVYFEAGPKSVTLSRANVNATPRPSVCRPKQPDHRMDDARVHKAKEPSFKGNENELVSEAYDTAVLRRSEYTIGATTHAKVGIPARQGTNQTSKTQELRRKQDKSALGTPESNVSCKPSETAVITKADLERFRNTPPDNEEVLLKMLEAPSDIPIEEVVFDCSATTSDDSEMTTEEDQAPIQSKDVDQRVQKEKVNQSIMAKQFETEKFSLDIPAIEEERKPGNVSKTPEDRVRKGKVKIRSTESDRAKVANSRTSISAQKEGGASRGDVHRHERIHTSRNDLPSTEDTRHVRAQPTPITCIHGYGDRTTSMTGPSPLPWTAEVAGQYSSAPVFQFADGRWYRHPQLPFGWQLSLTYSRKKVYYEHPDFGTTFCPPVILPSEHPVHGDGNCGGRYQTKKEARRPRAVDRTPMSTSSTSSDSRKSQGEETPQPKSRMGDQSSHLLLQAASRDYSPLLESTCQPCSGGESDKETELKLKEDESNKDDVVVGEVYQARLRRCETNAARAPDSRSKKSAQLEITPPHFEATDDTSSEGSQAGQHYGPIDDESRRSNFRDLCSTNGTPAPPTPFDRDDMESPDYCEEEIPSGEPEQYFESPALQRDVEMEGDQGFTEPTDFPIPDCDGESPESSGSDMREDNERVTPGSGVFGKLLETQTIGSTDSSGKGKVVEIHTPAFQKKSKTISSRMVPVEHTPNSSWDDDISDLGPDGASPLAAKAIFRDPKTDQTSVGSSRMSIRSGRSQHVVHPPHPMDSLHNIPVLPVVKKHSRKKRSRKN